MKLISEGALEGPQMFARVIRHCCSIFSTEKSLTRIEVNNLPPKCQERFIEQELEKRGINLSKILLLAVGRLRIVNTPINRASIFTDDNETTEKIIQLNKKITLRKNVIEFKIVTKKPDKFEKRVEKKK